MKKISFIISLLVLAAMVLSACSSSEGSEKNEQNNAAGTPGASSTLGAVTPGTAGTPGAAGTPAAAGTATLNPFGTGTPGAAMTATATTGSASGASTPATTGTPGVQPVGTGTPGGAGTPGAFLPNTGGSNTGANICRTDRLANIVNGMKILDAKNNEIGKVTGVILLRDSKVFAMDASQTPGAVTPASGTPNAQNNTNDGKTGTNNGNGKGAGNSKGKNPVAATASAKGQANAANNAAANNSAEAGNAAAGTPMVKVANSLQPMIDYLIVDLEKDAAGNNVSGKQVLVPYSAFNSQPNPANGVCGLTLKNQATVLANAPTVDAKNLPDMTAAGWDQSYRSFWAQQGLSIPATGTANSQYVPTVFTDKVADIKVTNPNNDDLGTVKDFTVNQQTGHFNYAIVQTGGLLGIGAKYVFVPVTDMAWVGTGKNDASDPGKLVINVTKDQFKGAPTLDDPNQVDSTAANWDQSIKAYWQGLTGSTAPAQNLTPPPSR